MGPKKQPSSRFKKCGNGNSEGNKGFVKNCLSANTSKKIVAVPKYKSLSDRREAFSRSTGLSIEITPSDGSCQYHSVLQGLSRLYSRNLPSVSSLRNVVATTVDWNIRNNDDFYTRQLMCIFTDSGDSQSFDDFFENYLLGIRCNAFGDELTLNVIAEIMQTNIRVFSPNLMNDHVSQAVYYGNPRDGIDEDRQSVSVLLFNQHYESLYETESFESNRQSIPSTPVGLNRYSPLNLPFKQLITGGVKDATPSCSSSEVYISSKGCVLTKRLTSISY